MFGVRENPKIPPQIRKIIALKSAHLDRAYWHVISNNSHLNPSCESNLLDFAQALRGSTGVKPSHASSEHVCSSALSAAAR
jgi:hypothetical protein